MRNIQRLIVLLIPICGLALTSGCASITGQNSQPVSVQTISDLGEVEGASCELENSKGKWFVKTPGSTVVNKASDDLNVICRKPGFDIGRSSLTSKANAGMWGNVILGGGIGAVIDHNSGAAYNYPPLVSVKMNEAKVGSDSTNQNPTLLSPGGPIEFEGNVALDKCKQLGFKLGTNEFGACVLRLSK